MRDSVGDPSMATGHSTKSNNSSLLSPTEKQRVIQYSSLELEEPEVSSNYHSTEMSGSSIAGLFQNVNASHVEEAEKLKRSKMKSTHEAKLERDRASRQLQQQRIQERKEKEKKRTQKQERRR